MLEIFIFINNNVKKKSAKIGTLTLIAHNSFIFKIFWMILVQDMRNDMQSKNLFYFWVLRFSILRTFFSVTLTWNLLSKLYKFNEFESFW